MHTNALDSTSVEVSKTYLRSEFLDAKGVGFSKTYRDLNGGTLASGDHVQVTISLTNSGSTPLRHISYLDSNDRTVFKETETPTYTRLSGTGGAFSGALEDILDGPFDLRFDGFDIAPGETVKLSYEMVANALAFGKFHA